MRLSATLPRRGLQPSLKPREGHGQHSFAAVGPSPAQQFAGLKQRPPQGGATAAVSYLLRAASFFTLCALPKSSQRGTLSRELLTLRALPSCIMCHYTTVVGQGLCRRSFASRPRRWLDMLRHFQNSSANSVSGGRFFRARCLLSRLFACMWSCSRFPRSRRERSSNF